MRVDASGRIVAFVEKPQDDAVLDEFALDADTIAMLGFDVPPGYLLASMGIYLFRAGVLSDLLERPGVDFGKEIIPGAIADMRVRAFPYAGYWEDIGTIGAFHSASLAMTAPLPPLDLYSRDRPIYTNPRFLPGTKINSCDVRHSILCEGSIISRSTIEHSIIGIRAIVRGGAKIKDSVVMGARFYERPDSESAVGQGIGRDCEIRNAIIDLDACIGDGARLVNEEGVQEADGDGWCIRDGVIVVPRESVIEPGTVV
jgi:glucose-1-phosphate adenylyltransferase